ncbi:MAG: hypothetical protein FWB96_12025 [Defluviitaleaceae bacterium]|nr:hypothetical protein [Defluviitaleaceae bacterium]MCL2263142.1 hypothetical protein [Defluviitaleaceae bacterium]
MLKRLVLMAVCAVLILGSVSATITTASEIEPASGFTTTPMIQAGASTQLFLRTDGTVWIEGYTQGLDLERRGLPVQVPGLRNIVQISMGQFYSLALRSDGTVWAWGENNSGQLGIGEGLTWPRPRQPVQVPGLNNIASIAAGSSGNSFAVGRDGTVWAWGGDIGTGNLGLFCPEYGFAIHSFTPMQVQGIDGVTAIAAGGQHTLALRYDGTVWGWGLRILLGESRQGGPSPPIQVQGVYNVTAISAVDNHSLALRQDGTVLAWGRNAHGQLGNGTLHCHITLDVPAPPQEVTISNVRAVEAGHQSSVALLTDGTVWTWGDHQNNHWNRQWNNIDVPFYTPIQMYETRNMIGISSMQGLVMMFCGDGYVWFHIGPPPAAFPWETHHFNLFTRTPPPPEPPPIDTTGVAPFIRAQGTRLYSPEIRWRTYGVYRVAGRVSRSGDGFVVTPSAPVYYLICSDGNLVTNRDTLQRAGFLHFDINARPAEQHFGDMQRMLGLVAGWEMEYQNQLQIYYLNQGNLAISRAAADLAIITVYGLKGDVPSMAGFAGKRVINDTGVFDGVLYLDTWQFLRALRKEAHETFRSNATGVRNSLAPEHPTSVLQNGFIANYNTAKDIERATYLFRVYSEYYRVDAKYLADRISRAAPNLAMGVILDVLGIVTRSPNVSRQMAISTTLSAGQKIVEILPSALYDSDLRMAENNIRRHLAEFNATVFNPRWQGYWGNTDFIRTPLGALMNQTIIISCPVNVSVYNADGALIGRTENHEKTYLTAAQYSTPLTIMTQDTATILIFPHENNYRIQISPTDSGTMTYHQFRICETGDVLSETIATNITIEPNENFTVNPTDTAADYQILFADNAPPQASELEFLIRAARALLDDTWLSESGTDIRTEFYWAPKPAHTVFQNAINSAQQTLDNEVFQ